MTTLASSAKASDPTCKSRPLLNLGKCQQSHLGGPIPATVWSVVEANTGTICACLPTLKQPLADLFPRLFSSSVTIVITNNRHSHDHAYVRDSHSHFRGAGLDNRFSQWGMSPEPTRATVLLDSLTHKRRTESEETMVLDGQGITRTTDFMVVSHNDGDSTLSKEAERRYAI